MANQKVHGTTPHDAVSDSPYPVPIGGVAATSTPSAVSSGDAVQAYFDEYGQLHVVFGTGTAAIGSIAAGTEVIGATKDAGSNFPVAYTYTTSADMQTAAALTAAPTSGQKLVIDDILFSTDTALAMSFQEETSNTVVAKVYCAANSVIQFTPRGLLRLPVADKKLFGDASAAGNVAVTVFYHSST